jgi:protein-S-isoprenylcysteine O-methyltransferase Ste14
MSRSIAAIVLEAVFFALAFGWRSWVQWHRTGSTGFIRPRRGAGAAELVGAIGFVTALLLLIAAPIADLSGVDQFAFLAGSWAAVVGLLLGVAGIALTLVAQLGMGDSWRIGVDTGSRTDLVVGGVFGSVRNPIFTAMVVAALGLVLLVPNVVSAVAFVVLVAALQVQVRLVEEPYLRATHGETYDAYRARVGRFVPHVGLSAGN